MDHFKKIRAVLLRQAPGVTLLELLTVLGILAILAIIGVPGVISWLNTAKVKGVASNIRADMELAKVRAIRENAFVVVQFASDSYSVFVDNGAGGATAGDWSRTGDEVLLINRFLSGVTIDLGQTTFANERTRFNGRGLPGNLGTVVVEGTGMSRRISLSRVGRITVQ